MYSHADTNAIHIHQNLLTNKCYNNFGMLNQNVKIKILEKVNPFLIEEKIKLINGFMGVQILK